MNQVADFIFRKAPSIILRLKALTAHPVDAPTQAFFATTHADNFSMSMPLMVLPIPMAMPLIAGLGRLLPMVRVLFPTMLPSFQANLISPLSMVRPLLFTNSAPGLALPQSFLLVITSLKNFKTTTLFPMWLVIRASCDTRSKKMVEVSRAPNLNPFFLPRILPSGLRISKPDLMALFGFLIGRTQSSATCSIIFVTLAEIETMVAFTVSPTKEGLYPNQQRFIMNRFQNSSNFWNRRKIELGIALG